MRGRPSGDERLSNLEVRIIRPSTISPDAVGFDSWTCPGCGLHLWLRSPGCILSVTGICACGVVYEVVAGPS